MTGVVQAVKVDGHDSLASEHKEDKAATFEKGQRERPLDFMTQICPNFINRGKPCDLTICHFAHGFENLRIREFTKPYKRRWCSELQDPSACSTESCTFLHPGEFIAHHDRSKLFALYTKERTDTYYLTRIFVTRKILKDNFAALRDAKFDFPARVAIPEGLFRKDANLRHLFEASTKIQLHSRNSDRARKFLFYVHQPAVAQAFQADQVAQSVMLASGISVPQLYSDQTDGRG
jgi:hypothetical protein